MHIYEIYKVVRYSTLNYNCNYFKALVTWVGKESGEVKYGELTRLLAFLCTRDGRYHTVNCRYRKFQFKKISS